MKRWLQLTWLIAWREVRQGGRSRAFRIVTIVLVLAVAAGVIIPAAVRGHHGVQKVGIVSGSRAAMTRTVQTAAHLAGATVEVVPFTSLSEAKTQLRAGALAAVLVSDKEVLVKQAPAAGGSGSSLVDTLAKVGGLSRLYALVPPSAAATFAEGISHGLSLPINGLVPALTGMTNRFTGLSMAILIYVMIVTYGARIAVGVGEEKTSRVVEVLLSAVRPKQLLVGKVLGMGMLAIAQVAAVLIPYLILGRFFGSSLVRSGSAETLGVGLMWILLGYAFYSTAFAAAGSLVAKPSDAYGASMPVQIPVILSYILIFTVIYNNSLPTWYWFLAFFPPTAPVSMTTAVAMGVAHPWEIALSAVLCMAATVGMAWLAGTIYGRAILRTGGRLKFRQALRIDAP